MTGLLGASLAFLLLHRVISGSPLREVIAGRVGETVFRRLFGIASLAILAWMATAYAMASAASRTELWAVPSGLWWASAIMQPVAILAIVLGATQPNPGTVGQENAVDRPDVVRGALRITRHPFLWGTALFAVGHMAARPSPRNLVLFGTLLLAALVGTWSIDRKRRRRLGTRWTPFAAATSNLPFAATLSGRQPWPRGEIATSALTRAALISALAALAHPAAAWLAAAF